jgi:molecular chaperone DnaJ
VLRDPQKRAAYDRYGKAGVGGAPGGAGFHHVDLSEALNIFMRDFGGMGGFESLFGGRARQDTRRGQDVRVTVKLSIAEVATKKNLKLKTLDRCPTCSGSEQGGSRPAATTCNGSGESVARPAAVRAVRVVSPCPCAARGGNPPDLRGLPGRSGKGGPDRDRGHPALLQQLPDAGVARGRVTANGDLLVMLDIREDDRFERSGDDLYDSLSFSQAALGGEFSVPTPYGDEQIRLPAGTQPETMLRLKAKGLPVLGQSTKGDLLIRVHLSTPERLTEEQQRLFHELAKLEGEPPKRSPGFWSKLKEALGA